MNARRLLLTAFLLAAPASAQDIPTYTLEDLERRAQENNPAFAQAEAAVRAADARRVQAGLWPNPVVGYTGEEIPLDRDDQDEGAHGVFISQEIPLGGKLKRSRAVLAQDLARTRGLAEAQRLRLLGDLRALHARTLAAQTLVGVRERLAGLAAEAVEVTDQLFNTGAADATDRLAIQNEAALAEADVAAARIELDLLWAVLRAAVADPDLAPGRLEGDLAAVPEIDREQWRQRLLAESPEAALAQADLARAEAALARAKAERMPDLEIEAGVREHYELPQTTFFDVKHVPGSVRRRDAFADIGLRIPLWNRNQGGIAAAEADLARARLEGGRVRLSLEARYASAFSRYRQAAERARTYREGVLDRARTAYQQYFDRYQEMTAAYPQVLIAQRTLFQLEEDYARTLGRAWEAAVGIQSLLASESSSSMTMNDTTGGAATPGH